MHVVEGSASSSPPEDVMAVCLYVQKPTKEALFVPMHTERIERSAAVKITAEQMARPPLSTGSVRLTRNLTTAITTRFTSAVLFSPCYTQAFSFSPSPSAKGLSYRGDAGLQMQKSAGEPIRMSPAGTMKIRQRGLGCCFHQQPRRYQFTRRCQWLTLPCA